MAPKENMEISVVIPTFNRCTELRRALASVYLQVLPAYEVIVIDDQSTDGTAEMLSAQFPKVRYERLRSKANAAAARNRGIRLAKGDLIAFLDSDDEWAPDHLRSAAHRLNPASSFGLVATSYRLAGDDNELFRTVRFPDEAVTKLLDRVLEGGIDTRSSTLICERFLAKSILFDESLNKHQDWDFAARCAAVTKVCTSSTTSAILRVNTAARMSSKPNHQASARFLQKHKNSMSSIAVGRFYLQLAQATLNSEGRTSTFYKYLANSSAVVASCKVVDCAKFMLLLVPGGQALKKPLGDFYHSRAN